MAKLLIEKGAKMDLLKKGHTILMLATQEGDYEMVKLFVDHVKKDHVNFINR